MKKHAKLLCCAAVLIAASGAALALYGSGWGKVVSATTTPQIIDGFTANEVSVYNSGTERVFVLANTTTNTMTSAIATNIAIPINGGTSYTFDANARDQISNVGVATTNSTSTVLIAAY